MPFLEFLVLLVAIGAVLYLVNKHIPMQPGVKRVLNIVVVVALVLFVLRLFGIDLLAPLTRLRIGR